MTAVDYRGLTVLIDDHELAYAVAPLFRLMAGGGAVSIMAAVAAGRACTEQRQGVLL